MQTPNKIQSKSENWDKLKPDEEKKEQLFRVECICSDCKTLLMWSNEKPHLTKETLRKNRGWMVMSAPLSAPRCPKCWYSTYSDCNSHFDLLIDDWKKKYTSEEWFNKFFPKK